jgi:hypothetical protein
LRTTASWERLLCFAYPTAALASSYHNRPNGSASEINQIDAAMISREKISTAINKAYELTTPSTTLARNA